MTLESKICWGLVALPVCVLSLFAILPQGGIPKAASDRTQCKHNLSVLAMAMHNYHDAYGSFPPAYIADGNGRPLHSWRVLLLPFLEHRNLYKLYRFDEPSDGPHNSALAARMPPEFRCQADTGPDTDASYFVVVGPKTVFPGATPVAIKDIPDGTSNTILLVEAVHTGIKWLEPRDLTYEQAIRGINPKAGGISSHHPGGAQVALADGSRRFLPDEIPVEQLKLLLQRDDGQKVSFH
jgi:hypothetical protein